MSFQSYTAKLIDKKSVKPDIYILTFELPPGQRVDFVAGQYLILHVPQGSGEFARRLYSIANSPDTDTIELVVKRVEGGIATAYVDAMRVGDQIAFQAPAGVFTMKGGGRSTVMLATNTGIVPFRSMILAEVHKGPLSRDIHLYWGMRHFDELYYFNEFKELAQKEPRFHFTLCLSRDEVARDGVINARIDRALISQILPKFTPYEHFDFYLCGGVVVIDTLREMLLAQGIEKKQIHFEKFT